MKPREFLEFDTPDTRWWLPFATRREFRRQVAALWREHLNEVEAMTVALERMRSEMTSAEDRAYERAGEVVALLKAEFASLKEQIDAAVQDKDAAVQAGVVHALAEDSAADAARLEGLLGELESVLPARVPEVEVPAPGEAAELPDEPS